MSAKNFRMFTTAIIISCFVFFAAGLLSAGQPDASRDIQTRLQAVLSDPNTAGYLPAEVTLDCINGSKLQLKRGEETLFVLLWNIEDANVAEFKAFGNLFFAGFDNPKVRFLGINLDGTEEKKNVVAELLKNSGPWAQVIAAEPGNNKVLKAFMSVGIKKPTLTIITPAGPIGQIKYVGSAASPEPQEILSRLSTITEKTKKTEERTPHREKSIEVDEDEFNPQAEKLLENAKMFFKIGNIMIAAKSYGRPIQMCRRIIKDYPNTKYADEARLLMRQVPQRYRKRYKITDEELGL